MTYFDNTPRNSESMNMAHQTRHRAAVRANSHGLSLMTQPGKPLESLGARPSPSTFKASIQSAPAVQRGHLWSSHTRAVGLYTRKYICLLSLSLSLSLSLWIKHTQACTPIFKHGLTVPKKANTQKPTAQTHQVCVHHFLDSELHTNTHKHISVFYVTQQHTPSHTHRSKSPRSHTHRGKPIPVFCSACF